MFVRFIQYPVGRKMVKGAPLLAWGPVESRHCSVLRFETLLKVASDFDRMRVTTKLVRSAVSFLLTFDLILTFHRRCLGLLGPKRNTAVCNFE